MSVGPSTATATQSLISRRVSLRLTSVAAAAVLAGSLLAPGTALAAEWVDVEGNTYESGTAASGSGSNGGTWSWDGADNMSLVDYNGGTISAGGTLNVDLTGTNVIVAAPQEQTDEDEVEQTTTVAEGLVVNNAYDEEGEVSEEAALTISGSGSLAVNGQSGADADYATGIGASDGALTIDGASVTVTLENVAKADNDSSQIGVSAGTLTVRNGAQLTVTSTNEDYEVSWTDEETGETETWTANNAIGIQQGSDTATSSLIDDSVVTVKASVGALNVSGGYDWESGTDVLANLTIRDSEVSLTSSTGNALYVNGVLTIENSDLDASSPEDVFAVLASDIKLSQETGDTTVVALDEEDDESWKTLGSVDPVQNVVKLRRTGTTPKHLGGTSVAAKASSAAGSIPQTSDPLDALETLALGIGAVSMIGLGKHLRRRDEE